MLSQNLTDWNLFLTNSNLSEYCQKLYEFIQTDYPITEEYVQRIEQYFNVEKPATIIENKSNETDIFSKKSNHNEQTNDDSDDSADVDDPKPYKKQRHK